MQMRRVEQFLGGPDIFITRRTGSVPTVNPFDRKPKVARSEKLEITPTFVKRVPPVGAPRSAGDARNTLLA